MFCKSLVFSNTKRKPKRDCRGKWIFWKSSFGLVYKRGFCIALLSQSATASSFLVAKLNHNTSNIGSTMFILEQKYKGKSLGKNSLLPLVATSQHLFHTNVVEPFPSPYDLNLFIGQTRYSPFPNDLLSDERGSFILSNVLQLAKEAGWENSIENLDSWLEENVPKWFDINQLGMLAR
jgi:hypothetical protein